MGVVCDGNWQHDQGDERVSIFGIFCVAWFVVSMFFCASASNAAREEERKKPDYSKLYWDIQWYVTLFFLGLLPQLLVAIYKLSIYVYSI